MRIIILFLLITSCSSYEPLVDTKGRSGTFDNSRAEELTDDIQHCKTLAKENSNRLKDVLLDLAYEEAEYKTIFKNCLTGRNHSVVL
jgi:hypothetical protein